MEHQTGRTFDSCGLKGGDIVIVVNDPRSAYFYDGMELRLRDTGRGIRAPDMTNGSAFTWKIKTA